MSDISGIMLSLHILSFRLLLSNIVYLLKSRHQQQSMIQTDSEIITRCQRGDKAAFREVVQSYQRMVFSLSLKMLADEEEAKDVVQETFIRVWRGIRSYDPQKPFRTWLYTIATRLCLDRLKRQKPIVPMPDDERTLHRFASDDNSQRQMENAEWAAIVRLLAEGLSEKQRIAFSLCQLEGLSPQEAEEMTDMDARQLKSNLYVARQTIRKRLKDLGYEEN